MFKIQLEIELEKALDERGIYFSCMNHDQLEKFWAMDMQKLPEPPADNEEDDRFLPDAVRDFKEATGQKKYKNMTEWLKDIGDHGRFLVIKKGMEDLFNELVLTCGITPHKFGVYKTRTAEIGDFNVLYKVGLRDLDKPEEEYKRGFFMHKVVLSKKTNNDKLEDILELKCYSDKITERNYGEKAKELMDSRIYVFKKYKRRQKLDAKAFVKDLMKLIGV